jgi:hypothetical protein
MKQTLSTRARAKTGPVLTTKKQWVKIDVKMKKGKGIFVGRVGGRGFEDRRVTSIAVIWRSCQDPSAPWPGVRAARTEEETGHFGRDDSLRKGTKNWENPKPTREFGGLGGKTQWLRSFGDPCRIASG